MAIFLDAACILLIIFTPLSYLPLLNRIYTLRSANGISITAALVLALCAQSQLVTLYYIWFCPPSKRAGEIIPRPPLSTDYLNLVQLLLQWLGSLLLLAALVAARSYAESSQEDGLTTPTEAMTTTTNGPSNRTIVMLLITHASLSVFWTIQAGTPSNDPFDILFVWIMIAQQIIIGPIVAIATGIAFGLQVRASKRTHGESALTRQTLLLPALLFLALAVSWPLRFRLPENLRYGRWNIWWVVQDWYANVGWACINNAIVAIGHWVLLYVVSGKTGSDVAVGTEREALLGT